MSDDLVWQDVSLGVMSWNGSLGCYVLRIPRIEAMPLSFNVWTKVATDER